MIRFFCLTFGASKQAGQFSGITGNCDWNMIIFCAITVIQIYYILTSAANWRRSFSLTYTNGRITLKSPSLVKQKQKVKYTISLRMFYVLDSIACLHGMQATIVKDGHEKAFSKIIQVLTHCQNIVVLTTST